MLTLKEAARIGLDACIDKIGLSFFEANRKNCIFASGENEELHCAYCYAGVDDKPYVDKHPGVLVLDSVSKWTYYASCNVSLTDGTVTFIDYALPTQGEETL